MKRITITICSAVMLFACQESTKTETSPDTKVAAANDTKNDPPLDSATKMKNWMAYMTPGKEHQMLAQSNGTWTSEMSMWEAPGAPVQKGTGTATFSMTMGGRYQQGMFKANWAQGSMNGISTTAFDNAKKAFCSTWIDDMGTGIMYAEGPWDDASKTITMKGNMIDPMTGKEVAFREVYSMPDNDHQTMKMYCNGPDGKEYQSMEVNYTRKK